MSRLVMAAITLPPEIAIAIHKSQQDQQRYSKAEMIEKMVNERKDWASILRTKK
ncbi:MAG: hypothetical protein K0U41_09075 [Gammaproteobacteria bacterium]|nr:hypothetical protein [Gammaproteobacteria bacterium]